MKKTNLSLLLILALVGCGSKNSSSVAPTSSPAASSTQQVSSQAAASSEEKVSSEAPVSSEVVSSTVATEAKVALTKDAMPALVESVGTGTYAKADVESTINGYTFISSQTFGLASAAYEPSLAELGCFQLKKTGETVAYVENKTAIASMSYIDVYVVSTYEYAENSIPSIYTGSAQGSCTTKATAELINTEAAGLQNSKGFDISIYQVRYTLGAGDFFKLANETSYAEYINQIAVF